MASVSLIEGFAKKIINMVPRPFYTEAAQKLVHEICETVYKDLETKDNKKYPRVEIIDIVEKFVKTHLENTDTETPSGIRKAIEDNLAKTTLEIYKDEKINMLLLQQILSEEIGPDGKPKENGIFYKSLEQSINLTNNPDSNNANNSGGVDNKSDDTDKEKKETDKDSETFAKKVVNELVNTNVEITQSEQPDTLNVDTNQNGGDPYTDLMNTASKKVTDFAVKNPLTTAVIAGVGSAALNGNKSGSGTGNGGNSTTNIGYEPNKNGVLPYIQTNCNGSGSGLGLPSVDLNFLSQFLDGLKEPIAEELVKKIQERLSDKTTDSLTVKRDIYEKILLVIQAHLQSKEGKDMLLGHIDRIIKKEVDILTTNDEIKKRLLKVIFKNKSSEIYKKLIEIIALHSSQIGIILAQENAVNESDNKRSKLLNQDTNQLKGFQGGAENDNKSEIKQNGGKDTNRFQVTTIDKVIQEFSEWLNDKTGSAPQPVNEIPVVEETNIGSSDTEKDVNETPIADAKILDDVVMVNSEKNDGKDNSISTQVETKSVISNDNSTETVDAGKENVDGQKNEQLSNIEILQDASTESDKLNEKVASDTDDTSVLINGENGKITTSSIASKLAPIKSKYSTNNQIHTNGSNKGGNPTKNKTKKRRTKNNKRKTSKTLKNKQKKRVTKKKNRKHKK